MAYRNGTYVAFHAQGTNRPGESDIDYYNLMKAWSAKTDDDFTMVNSHDKASAVRDSSKKATLKASLQERLRNSRNMVLLSARPPGLIQTGCLLKLNKRWTATKFRLSLPTPIKV
jgi:hypothetical protein